MQILNDPGYRKTFVYGNVLIKPDGGNNQITHYGGDSGTLSDYRKGTLYFYNNTIVSTRTGNTVVFRLSTIEETCDARNNIFFTTNPGTNLAMLAETGTLSLTNNWSKPSWRNSFEGVFSGIVTGGATMTLGTTPGFVDLANQNFHLLSGAQAVNAGTTLHPDVLATHNVVRQYVKHQTSEARPVNGSFDLGAYEHSTTAPMQILTTGLPNAVRFRYYNQALQASGGSGNYSWSVSNGTLPPGLWLDAATGVIRGRSRLKVNRSFTITAQDTTTLATTSRAFTIVTLLH